MDFREQARYAPLRTGLHWSDVLRSPFKLTGDTNWLDRHWGLAAFAAVILAFFYFIFLGKTIGTVGQQMMAYFPWRGAAIDFQDIRIGYPQSDFADSFFPHWKFLASELNAGRLPLWYPFDYAGTRSPETGLFGFYYPPRIVILAILGPLHGHTAMMLLHSFLALLFSFKFLRWLGCTCASSFMGAMIWTFNGHNIYYMPLEFILVIAAWLPLTLWSAGQAVEKRSPAWATLCGFSIGISWLNGYANYNYAFGLVISAWWLLLIIPRLPSLNRRDTWRLLRLPFIVAGVALAAGAAFWLPFLDVFQTAVRVPSTITDQLQRASSPSRLIGGMLWPKSLSGPVWGGDPDSFVFVGIPAVLLLPFVILRPNRTIVFFAALGGLAFIFMAGFLPLYRFGHAFVPMFGAIHPSTIGAQLLMLAMSVLAAFGLDRAINLLRARKRAAVAVSWSASTATVISLFALLHMSQSVQPASSIFAFPQTPLTKALARVQQTERTRLVPAQIQSGTWMPPIFFAGSAAAVGVNSVFGYDSLVQPENYWIARLAAERGKLPDELNNPDRPFLGFLNAREMPIDFLDRISAGVVASAPGSVPQGLLGEDLAGGGRITKLYEGSDGTLWRSNQALPRAFLSPALEIVDWGPPALKKLTEPTYQPGEKIALHPKSREEAELLARFPSSKSIENSKIIFMSDLPNKIKLLVQSDKPAILVLNDTWAPGWQATINGFAHPIIRANYAYRAVIIPAGTSKIIFNYRPRPLIYGITFTIFSIIIMSVLAISQILNSRQRRRGNQMR